MRKLIKNPAVISVLPIFILLALTIYKVKWSGKQPAVNSFFGNQKVIEFCVDEVCLNKEGSDWLVKDKEMKIPADNELAQSYADKFKDVNLSQLVSENKDKFILMGIGSSKTLLVVNGKKLELGKISDDYSGTYVKEEGIDKVFLSKVPLSSDSLKDINYWKRKFITNVAQYQIKKVSVKKDGKIKELSFSNNKWENENAVTTAAHLQSRGFLNGFVPQTASTEITMETDNDKVTLKIGRIVTHWRNENYWATEDNKYYFEINKADFDLLTGI